MLVVLGALLCPHAGGSGLRDNPIAGGHIEYLDGTAWTANQLVNACEFVADVDYDSGSAGPRVVASSREECCDMCWATDACAAAVFVAGSLPKCWLKTIGQLTRPAVKVGATACVRSSRGRGLSIPARVPGDLISDLYNAGQIGNPLYEVNWLNSSIWNDYRWAYTTEFEADPQSRLVFDGIKMGATIYVNGVKLGNATDQFLRYIFPLDSMDLLRKSGKNTLEVVFPGSSMSCGGRWMACTGGWDWAPYTNTKQEGAATFTKGIWKSVYIVKSSGVAIDHFVPHVFYTGKHATSPLRDGQHSGFQVHARVHLWANVATTGFLMVTGSWGSSALREMHAPAGASSTTLLIDANASNIKLWWPAGLGAQTLYNVTATWSPVHPDARPLYTENAIQAQRRIGFRSVALVTGDDTDPAYVERASTEEGSNSHGMVFRINGAAIMARGANMIPMDELEGWLDADAHRLLVQSAADARMNTLRVWGGGMILPDAWYDACDELGILVYHDMMYAQHGHAPRGTATEDAELRHTVRRLSHHASIIVWDGCNECRVKMNTPTAIYATFVMTTVAEEDASRPVWPSCPSIGWATGVHKLNSLPNGKALTTPDDGSIIEKHGPYQHGSGFPAVNGGGYNASLFDPNVPVQIRETDTGLSVASRFFSEFGAVVMSSFESMSPTLDPEHWALHAGQPDSVCEAQTCTGTNVMAQRNYPCDNLIYVYFGHEGQDLNRTGEGSFKKQLYQCMIAQALEVKQKIEARRSENTFGLLIWQLNEIWPTGGWGSIEYGNPAFPGQAIGGRWKPLHYWYRSSLFADVMAACGKDGQCYVRNDSPWSFEGDLLLQSSRLSDGHVATILSQGLAMPAGPGSLHWLHSCAVANLDAERYALEAIVMAKDRSVVSSNVVALATPERLRLPKSHVAVTAELHRDGSLVANVVVNAVAMYVTLTTRAHGHFDDNAFLLRPPGRLVKFIPASPSPHPSLEDTFEIFNRTLRVEDVSAYAASSPPPPPPTYADYVRVIV